MFQLWFIIFV